MKFTLKSKFAKLSLSALAVALVAELTGRVVSANGLAQSCIGWPLCQPTVPDGWLHLVHRVAVLLTIVITLVLWRFAWSRLRDQIILLPLSTVVTILFFANVFVGAQITEMGAPHYLSTLHSLTGVGMWISLFSLVVASGYYANDSLVEFLPINYRERVKDFLILTKPIIVTLLLATTAGGMIAGMKALPPLDLFLWTLLGGAMAAGGASAINQYIDRDLDRKMQRTSNRPLAAGRLLPAEGLAFGLALSIISFYIFAGFVNLLAALLSLAGIVYYVWLYSILLKKSTAQNIVIGGGAGAIPPMVGWAAATGSLSVAAWFLFAIIFLWTPPHFWALSIVRRKDYERAGVPMLPVTQGEKETRRQIWLYTLALVGVSIAMPLLHLTGIVFFVLSMILGIWLLSAAWKVYHGEGNRNAWKMYRYSSMYLLFIFGALVADTLIGITGL